jgi:uncharacterized protein YjbJ (UPF0337 family)
MEAVSKSHCWKTMTIHEEHYADSEVKEVEGKLQAAVGELIGDTGLKLKGEAKQVQAGVMKIGEHVEEGIKNLAQKVVDHGQDREQTLK